MPGNHGGARPGAGRKSNAERHQEAVTQFVAGAAEQLPQTLANLIELANGKGRQIIVEYAAAGSVFRKDVVRNVDGSVYLDAKGKPVNVQVLAFPGLPAEQIVKLRVKVVRLAKDFKANEALADRVAGSVTPAPTPDPEGIDLREALEIVKQRRAAYIDPDDLPTEEEQGDIYHGA